VTPGMVPTLGLFGVTINSMALIAPGAFLWTTFQLQAASSGDGKSYAGETFTGIIFAVWIAFMTAFPFAELAKVYPEAGSGGAYYFAERSFKHSTIVSVRKFANPAKWFIGWSTHLFYWVYPGVTTALMTIVIAYLIQSGQPPGTEVNPAVACVIATACAGVVALVAVKGINFSTTFNIGVVIMQSVALFMYSVMFCVYRSQNPRGYAPSDWYFQNVGDMFQAKSFTGILLQSSIAILILVGFDSATQLGAETINPARNVSTGCVLSLAIQALISYPLEYITALSAMTTTSMKSAVTSPAPIGDLVLEVGDAFGLRARVLMIVLAITVLISIFGTTLAAANSAVRVSLFMASEGQFPQVLCKLHSKYRTPWVGILVSFVVNATLGMAGSAMAVQRNQLAAITGITLASNIGTFLLYAGICCTCIFNFIGKPEFNWWRHGVVPFIGMILNLMEVFVVFIAGIQSGGDTMMGAFIAFGICAVWAVIYCVAIYYASTGTFKAKIGEHTAADEWSIRTKTLSGLPSAFPGHEEATATAGWSVHPSKSNIPAGGFGKIHDDGERIDPSAEGEGRLFRMPPELEHLVPQAAEAVSELKTAEPLAKNVVSGKMSLSQMLQVDTFPRGDEVVPLVRMQPEKLYVEELELARKENITPKSPAIPFGTFQS